MWIVVLLFACTPPSLVVSGPSGVVHGAVEFEVVSNRDAVVVAHGGVQSTVAPGQTTLDTSGWSSGGHEVVFSAKRGKKIVEQTIPLNVDNSGPSFVLPLVSLSVKQGYTLPVWVESSEPVFDLVVEFDGTPLKMYEVRPNLFRAYVGIAIRRPPGEYAIVVSGRDGFDNGSEQRFAVAIEQSEWPFTGTLRFKKGKAKVESAARKKMREERDGAYTIRTDEMMLTGRLSLPVKGAELTSMYGAFREYPDGKRSHHDALDLALKRGTPVMAAGPGEVVIARQQALHGNAVIVNHGQGVFTLYSHHDSLTVKENTTVSAGQQLGTMGDTGRATGPHSHFGLIVSQVAVNPMQWIDNDLVAIPSVFEH